MTLSVAFSSLVAAPSAVSAGVAPPSLAGGFASALAAVDAGSDATPVAAPAAGPAHPTAPTDPFGPRPGPLSLTEDDDVIEAPLDGSNAVPTPAPMTAALAAIIPQAPVTPTVAPPATAEPEPAPGAVGMSTTPNPIAVFASVPEPTVTATANPSPNVSKPNVDAAGSAPAAIVAQPKAATVASPAPAVDPSAKTAAPQSAGAERAAVTIVGSTALEADAAVEIIGRQAPDSSDLNLRPTPAPGLGTQPEHAPPPSKGVGTPMAAQAFPIVEAPALKGDLRIATPVAAAATPAPNVSIASDPIPSDPLQDAEPAVGAKASPIIVAAGLESDLRISAPFAATLASRSQTAPPAAPNVQNGPESTSSSPQDAATPVGARASSIVPDLKGDLRMAAPAVLDVAATPALRFDAAPMPAADATRPTDEPSTSTTIPAAAAASSGRDAASDGEGDAAGENTLPPSAGTGADVQPEGQTSTDGFDSLAHAASRVQSATPAAPQAPAQIAAAIVAAVPANLASSGAARRTRFDVQLDEGDLGRIEVRLDISNDGRVATRLLVDRPETLALLRQDAGELTRTLEQAGFRLTGEGLSFQLRDGAGDGWRQPETAAPTETTEADDDLAVRAAPLAYDVRAPSSALDMRV